MTRWKQIFLWQVFFFLISEFNLNSRNGNAQGFYFYFTDSWNVWYLIVVFREVVLCQRTAFTGASVKTAKRPLFFLRARAASFFSANDDDDNDEDAVECRGTRAYKTIAKQSSLSSIVTHAARAAQCGRHGTTRAVRCVRENEEHIVSRVREVKIFFHKDGFLLNDVQYREE